MGSLVRRSRAVVVVLASLVAGCSRGCAPGAEEKAFEPPAKPTCGNRVVEANEACDDGNDDATDGCHRCARIEQLSAGEKHSCMLTSDGTVTCWGSNEWFQSGRPTKAFRVEPAPNARVPLVGKAVAIASGDHHSCAILEGGRVQCWGANGSRQLHPKLDPKKQRWSPLAPPLRLPSPAKALALGSSHTCALSEDARVRCWGARPASMATDGPPFGEKAFDDDPPAFDLGPGVSIAAIAARKDVTCALATDGSVRCFGSTTSCQGGSFIDGPTCEKQPGATGERVKAIALGKGRRADAVSVEEMGPAILLDDGHVKRVASGTGLTELLAGRGDGARFGDAWEPEAIGDRVPRAIASGDRFSCVIDAEGSVACWGDCLVYTRDSRCAMDAPVKIDLGKPAKTLAVGSRHACALLQDGTARCFGRNAAGELGATVPAVVGPPLPIH